MLRASQVALSGSASQVVKNQLTAKESLLHQRGGVVGKKHERSSSSARLPPPSRLWHAERPRPDRSPDHRSGPVRRKATPELARGLGQSVNEFKKAKEEFDKEVAKPATPSAPIASEVTKDSVKDDQKQA